MVYIIYYAICGRHGVDFHLEIWILVRWPTIHDSSRPRDGLEPSPLKNGFDFDFDFNCDFCFDLTFELYFGFDIEVLILKSFFSCDSCRPPYTSNP